MADTVDSKTRNRMMPGIRGKNAQCELIVPHCFHAMGFRYRPHGRKLPGTPDPMFLSRRVVIPAHGRFRHGHRCCPSKWPTSWTGFRKGKISGNRERDGANPARLGSAGLHIQAIRERALRGRFKRSGNEIAGEAARRLRSGGAFMELNGNA